MLGKLRVSEGVPYPRGATVDSGGVNFALFSANAERVELCLFDPSGRRELRRIEMEGFTDQVWHVRVDGLGVGTLYGYRVHGPYAPDQGHRFNPAKLLLDPYCRKVFGKFRWSNNLLGYNAADPQQDLVRDPRDNGAEMLKAVVTDDSVLDISSQSVPKPHIPWYKTIVYETHVKGYTKLHAAIPVHERGTIAALSHPSSLRRLRALGVTAIELLPIHSFIDERFLKDQGLTNYWGYNTLSFFSVHRPYLASGEREEFKRFVDAAHAENLEIILDVVYNHTCEGNHLGPTLSFRGIDNASYYALEASNPRMYVNDTGCGNTLNLRHPRVLQLVMDSLRYWSGTMGVDGFRFDLATVLGREQNGFSEGSGFFDAVRQDPVLADCKMIAEPWDIGPGGYQLGRYPPGWSEWNDKYRDTVRRFWRGDEGVLPEFARRIHGSSDLFEHNGRSPSATINFLTSHDGFTLHDVVSYSRRHNEANKENNRDGHSENFGQNNGVEGETDDPVIIERREQQKRNMLFTLILSQGTPMLLAGDEFGRSQHGNNNAYCQDNEINWIDWAKIDAHGKALESYVQHLIAMRLRFPLLTAKNYMHKPEAPEEKDIGCVHWFNSEGQEMAAHDWQTPKLKRVAWVIENMSFYQKKHAERCMLYLIFNSDTESCEFTLPEPSGVNHWHYLVDSTDTGGQPKVSRAVAGSTVTVSGRSAHLWCAHYGTHD